MSSPTTQTLQIHVVLDEMRRRQRTFVVPIFAHLRKSPRHAVVHVELEFISYDEAIDGVIVDFTPRRVRSDETHRFREMNPIKCQRHEDRCFRSDDRREQS